MRAILKIGIILLAFVQVTVAQTILPMGLGQKNSTNVVCSYQDKVWVVNQVNEDFTVTKWDGNFWIDYPQIPQNLLSTISSGSGTIAAKGTYYFNNAIYVALTNTENGKLLLIKSLGKVWEKLNTDGINVYSNITFLETLNGLMICGKITVGINQASILRIENNECKIYAGLTANHSANDYFSDFIYNDSAIWAFGLFTSPSFESRYFAKLDKTGNWVIVPSSLSPFDNGNIAIGEYKTKLVMVGKDFDEKLTIQMQKNDNSWFEISNGLDDATWKIEKVSDIKQFGANLWMAGSFRNIKSNKRYSLVFFNGTSWTIPEFDYLGDDVLLNGESKVHITGAFAQYQGLLLNHTGILDFGSAMVAGKVFNDLNKNCIQDNGEVGLAGIMIHLTPEDIYIPTDYNGHFYLPIDSNRTKHHFVIIQIPKYATLTCGNTAKAAIISSQSTLANYDYGIVANGTHPDASVLVSDFTGWRTRQGFTEKYVMCVNNKGTTTIEKSKLVLNVDSRFTNWNFNVNPTNQKTNQFEWELGSIGINQKQCINFSAVMPIETELGSEVLFNATIQVNNLKDEDETNNAFTLKQKVVAAIDPNDKASKEGELIKPDTKQLTYKIRFQNTGNDVAERIVVTDTIDPNLHFSALGTYDELSHAASHAPVFWLENGKYRRKMAWIFDNIMLPDSKSNEPESHGFINYTMNLSTKSTLPLGTVIKNTAYIYFDYQEAIITNTVKNTVANEVGINKTNLTYSTLQVYPNPAHDFIVIENPKQFSVEFSIYNAMGQLITSDKISPKEQMTLSTDNLPSGLYLIKAEGYNPVKVIVD